MTGACARAPILAWLLTALTCLLAGMAVVESRHQAVALPYPAGTRSPAGVVESVVTADAPPPSPAPTRSLPPLVVDVSVPPSTGHATVRVERLTIPPGVGLPAAVAAVATVLLVETGPLTVWVDGANWLEQGLEGTRTAAVLGHGERLVVAPRTHYAVRNDSPTPVVVLVAAVVPGAPPTPMLGPGEPPTGVRDGSPATPP